MLKGNKIKQDILEQIQSDLLSALFSYAVPFLQKKIDVRPLKNKPTKKQSNLENIVQNSKPRIDFADVKELEETLLKNLNENIQARKKVGINQSNIFYALNFTRQKNNQNNRLKDYSITIKYEENSSEERLKLTINSNGKEIYSAETTNKKEAKDKVSPYKITINYDDNYAEERLTITYKQQLRMYLKHHIDTKEDMSNMVPLKWLNVLPESIMGGILGFTYIGDPSMGRRADLTGKTARMVDIHESIHTPDEYETRVLTSWIMEKARGKYIK